MKEGIGKYIVRGLVGGALVATPAFGGQLASACAKAVSPTVAGWNNTLVDAGACVGIAAIETGVAALVGGKKAMVKTGVLAFIGAGIGTLLPVVDDGVDSVAQSILGTKGAAAAATTATPGGMRMIAGGRTPGGIPKSAALGGTMPGGIPRSANLGGTIPGGGRDGVASTRAYAGARGSSSSPPGGVL